MYWQSPYTVIDNENECQFSNGKQGKTSCSQSQCEQTLKAHLHVPSPSPSNLHWPILSIKWSISITRMHSSRMRTARLLPVSPSMHCSGKGVFGGGNKWWNNWLKILRKKRPKKCKKKFGGCIWSGGYLVRAGCTWSWGGCTWSRGCTWSGGLYAPGGCIPACTEADTPPR